MYSVLRYRVKDKREKALKVTERKLHNEMGFSLVEMMIAICIVSILMSMSVYSWRRYVINQHLRTAARNIINDIQYCKARTVAESRQFKITFSPANDNYTISAGATADLPAVSIVKQPVNPSEASPIDIVSTDLGSSTINFLTRGTISAGGNVNLQNTRNSNATVTVNRMGKAYAVFAMQ